MKFEKQKEILNQLVADLSQFSVVIHQTHWYMRGPEFLTLHPQMDEYMDQINEQLDVVSERLITLDGSPFSTLREFAENTKIEDEIGNWDRTIPERMEKLVAGYRYLADLYAKESKFLVKKATTAHKTFSSQTKQTSKKYLDVTSQTWQSAWY